MEPGHRAQEGTCPRTSPAASRGSSRTCGGPARCSTRYVHDANDNVTAQTLNGVTTTFNYDRNRLQTAVTGTSTQRYNYDPWGRLDTVTNAGVVLQRDVYDGFDRVTTLRTNLPGAGGQDQTNYTYDPLDRTTNRIEHVGTASQKNTALAYMGLSDQIVDEQVSGQVQKTYQSTPWGELLSQTKHNSDGTTEDAFYGYDPHSSVETLTDTAGDTKATYGYTAYGQNDTQSFTGVDKPDPQDPTKQPYNFYGYTAKRFDPASGRYDLGFRDYDPGLNQFITRDLYNGALDDLHLATDPFTSNRYSFAAGNPTSMVDQTGHSPTADNPVSANPELNKWLTTKWEAPKRYERRKAQSDFNDWFYETFNTDRPTSQWNALCRYVACALAAGKVLRGEWSAQQGLKFFGMQIRENARFRQGLAEFLDMLASTPPTAEIGVIGGFFRALAGGEDALKAIGFAGDAVESAYQGMRGGGGHAMRHLIDEGLIPNAGTLQARAELFKKLTSPILLKPAKTFDWKVGGTQTRAFAGYAGGKRVVVFVAKEGPYQGRVISAVVPDANQVAEWGLG